MLSYFIGKDRPRLILIAAVLLLLILGAILFYLLRNASASPEERLIASIEARLASMHTVQGRLQITVQSVVLEQELWLEHPNLLRTETESGPSAFAGTIVVLNETEGWVYSPALFMATVVDRTDYSPGIAREAGVGSMLERMPNNLLDALRNNFPARVGGPMRVANRATTALEIVVPDGQTLLPPGLLQVWLDDQYGYPLAWKDGTGREIRFTMVRFNEPIDPATFIFIPPPGADVRRVQPE
jgi:outer membrane lipoprotein-sorting protein